MAFYTRYLEQLLHESVATEKICLVLGASQTGKSTLFRHFVNEGSFIVNLQDSRKRLRYEREPGLLIRALQAINRGGRISDYMLIYGNLPGLFSESRASRMRTLAAYAELYIEEKIRKEALDKDIGGFARFLQFAAIEAGRIVNITKLSHDCHIPVNTIKGYYQLLEDTFIGIRIPAFGRSRKRILTSPRFCPTIKSFRVKICDLLRRKVIIQ